MCRGLGSSRRRIRFAASRIWAAPRLEGIQDEFLSEGSSEKPMGRLGVAVSPAGRRHLGSGRHHLQRTERPGDSSEAASPPPPRSTSLRLPDTGTRGHREAGHSSPLGWSRPMRCEQAQLSVTSSSGRKKPGALRGDARGVRWALSTARVPEWQDVEGCPPCPHPPLAAMPSPAGCAA